MMANVNRRRLLMFNIIITLISVILVLSSTGTEQEIRTKPRRKGINWLSFYAAVFGDDIDNHHSSGAIQSENVDDKDDSHYWPRQGNAEHFATIDAFNPKKCGKANYAEFWMGKLNSFHCRDSRPINCRRGSTECSGDGDGGWTNRIAGGYFPKLGDFPSAVSVVFALNTASNTTTPSYCGGVLIHDDMVLTAAHCIPRQDGPQKAYVVAGSLGVNNQDGQGVVSIVTDHCASPLYREKKHYSDWALLLLNQSLVYSPWVQPACLELWRKPFANVACVTAGYGLQHPNYTSRHLKAALLRPCALKRQPEWNRQVLDRYYYGNTCYERIISNQSMPSGNPCPGDGGSPMYCFDNCREGKPRMYAVAFAHNASSCNEEAVNDNYYTDLYKLAVVGTFHSFQECNKKFFVDSQDRRRRWRSRRSRGVQS